jgi:peptidoglycan/LPS O-acetylase OafA/YrhL
VLVQDWIPGQAGTILVVAWTLGIEAAFYVLVPVVAWAVRRRRPTAGPAALAAGVVGASALSMLLSGFSGAGGATTSQLVNANIPGTLVYFAPGVLLAIAETMPRARRLLVTSPRRRAALTLAALAGWVLIPAAQAPFGDPLRGWIGASLVVAWTGAALLAARGIGEVRTPALRGARAVGVWSYGVYLWHWPVVQLLASGGVVFAGGRAEPLQLATAVLAAALTLPLAALSWRYIEAPCLDRVAALVRRGRPLEPAASEERLQAPAA